MQYSNPQEMTFTSWTSEFNGPLSDCIGTLTQIKMTDFTEKKGDFKDKKERQFFAGVTTYQLTWKSGVHFQNSWFKTLTQVGTSVLATTVRMWGHANKEMHVFQTF